MRIFSIILLLAILANVIAFFVHANQQNIELHPDLVPYDLSRGKGEQHHMQQARALFYPLTVDVGEASAFGQVFCRSIGNVGVILSGRADQENSNQKQENCWKELVGFSPHLFEQHR